MSRRSNQRFRCQPLADLTRQLLFTPPAKRLEQMIRAERLHDQLDPAINYPFDFIQFRITGYRSQSDLGTLLVGEAVLPDVRLMIDALSHSLPIAVNDANPAESVEQLAAQLRVSAKTITRFRRLGLRWRWVIDEHSERQRIGFTPEAVNSFLKRYGGRVERASRFTQMDDGLKVALLARARRIARARPVSLNQVAAHLSRKTGRAIETLRRLLEQHDREHPNDPIFADHARPLSTTEIRAIARAYRRGTPVGALALQYRRTRSTIYRAVRQRKAAALRRLPLQFVASPMFNRNDADEVLLRPQDGDPPASGGRPATPLSDDLPELLRPMFERPVMDASTLRIMLVRYNYLKYKAAGIIAKLNPHEPRAGDLAHAETCVRQAGQLRRRLIAAGWPIVLAVSRRHQTDQHEASLNRLLRLLDRGCQVLAGQLDQFDPWRDQTFETFLTWQLLRDFALQHAEEAGSVKALRRVTAESLRAKLGPIE